MWCGDLGYWITSHFMEQDTISFRGKMWYKLHERDAQKSISDHQVLNKFKKVENCCFKVIFSFELMVHEVYLTFYLGLFLTYNRPQIPAFFSSRDCFCGGTKVQICCILHMELLCALLCACWVDLGQGDLEVKLKGKEIAYSRQICHIFWWKLHIFALETLFPIYTWCRIGNTKKFNP